MWNAIQALLQTLPHALLVFSLQLLIMGLVFGYAERKLPVKAGKPGRQIWTRDIIYYYSGMIVSNAVLILVVNLAALLLHSLGSMPWHAWVAQLNAPVSFVTSIALSEVAYYWVHRIAHQVPFFWRFHAVHHNTPHLYWLCASRTHPLDLSFFRAFIFVSLYVVGFGHGGANSNSIAFAFYAMAVTIWSYFIHSNIHVRLGWLDYVVTTPLFHHWHHTTGDPALVDKNFSANFPFMDFLFSTAYLPKNEWPEQYGLDYEIAPNLWG